eukprot:TRINITY_DN66999_c4_g1_i2.p1 TRINITY_DN66999_c4_g1~~TRINITY_DN66999_c4_g1_i2.p1  ORF type:complete len:601 (+),score=273.13 TRINITY_DN66999_c4_g1_i2:104-1906(+)
MRAPRGGGDEAQQPQMQNPCEQCCANCLAGTRVVSWTCLFSIVLGMIFGRYFWNVPGLVIGGQVWRLLVPFLFANTLFDGLFSILIGFSVGMRLEARKGTLYYLHATITIAVLTQLAYFVVALILIVAKVGGATSMYTGGMWPVMFGLLAVEALSAPEDERPFMCFPTNVQTKYYAVALCALFSVFSLLGGPFPVDMWVGLGMGYVFHHVEQLQPTTARLRAAESSERYRWIVSKPNFVSVDQLLGEINPMAGFMQQQQQPGAPGAAGRGGGPGAAPAGRTFGSGRASNAVSMSDLNNGSAASSQAAQPQRPSVFASGGHTLGSRADNNSSGTSSNANNNSSSSAAADQSRRAAMAARYERLARQAAGNSSGSGGRTSNSGSRSATPASSSNVATSLAAATAAAEAARARSAAAASQQQQRQRQTTNDDDEEGEQPDDGMISINFDRVTIGRPSQRQRRPEFPQHIDADQGADDAQQHHQQQAQQQQPSSELRSIHVEHDGEDQDDDDDDDTRGLLPNATDNPFAQLAGSASTASHDDHDDDADEEHSLLRNNNGGNAASVSDTDDNVLTMIELGYSREDAIRALSLNNNDLHGAIEFLS